MIDVQVLVITLGLLLGILALTTAAAVVNKIHSNREDESRRRFLDRLRQNFLLLAGGHNPSAAYREIGTALTGRWSQIAAEEVSQLELSLRHLG